MEKILSKFNIANYINNGIVVHECKCKECNSINKVEIKHKLNKHQITIFKCNTCGTLNKVGEIYNFTSGSNTNQRLDKRYNNETYLKREWT